MTYKVKDSLVTEVHAEEHDPKTGCCNDYLVIEKGNGRNVLAEIGFQNGPTSESVNGCQIEDLLTICRHRLHSLQSSGSPQEENAVAIDHITKALDSLTKLTNNRVNRGVTNEQKQQIK